MKLKILFGITLLAVGATAVGGCSGDTSCDYECVETDAEMTHRDAGHVDVDAAMASDASAFVDAAMAGDASALVDASQRDAASAGDAGAPSPDASSPSCELGYILLDGACTPTRVHAAYVKASTTRAFDNLGACIALSEDGARLAVGAPGDGASPGAVYVFVRSGTAWAQEARLQASNPDNGDQFGASVSFAADGLRIAVGAPNEDSASDATPASDTSVDSGAVYVFLRTGTTWTQEAYVKAQTPEPYVRFGMSVSLSADGASLAIGAPNWNLNSGAAYVYRRTATTWAHDVRHTGAPYSSFGTAVALSADGRTIAVGATGESSNATGIDGDETNESADRSGAVYVLRRLDGGVWIREAYVKASNTDAHDNFGCSVSLSSDGNVLAVGALGEDSSAVGVDGDESGNDAPQSGAAYVFRRDITRWTQDAYIKASNTDASDDFGTRVSISGDGAVLAIGATGESSAATGIGGDETNNDAAEAGAVYVIRYADDAWSQEAYVKAHNTDSWDSFGISVALSQDGAILAVGAFYEDGGATGVDGDATRNDTEDSGAAYIFGTRE